MSEHRKHTGESRNQPGKRHSQGWLARGAKCAVLAAVAVSLAAALAGCGADRAPAAGGQPADAAPPPAAGAGTETGGVKPAEPPAKPAHVYPLTGLPAEREVSDRPVMVMVENSPAARPQTGLDQADIVYEVLAEGDITRFAAVFHSKSPKTIGPVRSIRPYYVEIGDGWDALIVHAGWSQDAINMIAGRKLEHFDEVYGDGKYYWRDSSRKMPHNLYTSIDLIRQGAADKKFRAKWNGPILKFAEPGTAVQGSGAAKVSIPYMQGYTVSYDYDPGSGAYLRSINGEPHKDKQSGHTLSAVNLLICEAKHRILDKEGRREVNMFGPGKGILLQQGHKLDITWERKEGIIRAYAGGKEVPLLPGTTWVQIVPEGTNVKTEGAN
jgi:hypothetical protein